MANTGVQRAQWACSNPACSDLFNSVGLYKRHRSRSTNGCQNPAYQAVRLHTYANRLATENFAAIQDARIARAYEQDTLLPNAFPEASQPPPLVATHTHPNEFELSRSFQLPTFQPNSSAYSIPVDENEVPLNIGYSLVEGNGESTSSAGRVCGDEQSLYYDEVGAQMDYSYNSLNNTDRDTAELNRFQYFFPENPVGANNTEEGQATSSNHGFIAWADGNVALNAGWEDVYQMNMRGGEWVETQGYDTLVDENAVWALPDGSYRTELPLYGVSTVPDETNLMTMELDETDYPNTVENNAVDDALNNQAGLPDIEIPLQQDPPLYNPFNDGADPAYHRIETPDGGVTFEHATAGRIVQIAGSEKSGWHKLREENIAKHGGCRYGRWGTKTEWEDARWMAKSKSSQASLEEVLKTERYASNPPKFKSVKNLFDIIDKELTGFAGPEWTHEEIRLPEAPGEQNVMFFRDLGKVGDNLFGTPRFAGKMAFKPVVKFDKNGVREYSEPNTADLWHERQRNLKPGTTLGAGILMSDATVLSQFSGDVQAHGVYMSLGNINKEVRADISNGAWLLVALIPKSKWTKTLAGYGKIPEKERTALLHLLNRRLFHRCLEKLTEPFQCTEPHEALDPEGNTRLVQYELSIYGADLEEQCHIAGTARNTCPQCIAQGSTLGNPECQCIRSSESILRDIKKIFRDYNTTFKRNPTMRQFLEQCKKYDLNGVHKPFWRRLPDFDICKVLSPDMLHGVHKMFFDHIYKWNVNGLGLRESDTRLIAQIPTAGERSFPQGASKLQQLSGKDHRALERVHLPIVAHAPSVAEGGGGSQKLTKATRGIMDCIFLAQYPIQNEQTLAAFEESYRTFHANKEVWIENKSKRSKKRKKTKKGTSNVIEGWAIQKIHILRHIPEHIRLKGTMDNYNTETMEHLHRPMLKDTYKSTNRREWIKQITNLLKRSETIRNYTEWMEWNHEETERVSKEETGEQGIPQDDFGEEEEEGKDGADGEEAERVHRRWMDSYVAIPLGTRVGLDGECRREDDGWEGGQELLEPLGRQEQPGFGDGQMVMECNAGTVDNGTTDDVQMEPVCDFPTTPTPYYRVAINPTARRVVVNLLMGRFDLPRFVTHLHQHPYFAALPTVVDEGSRLNVWTLMRIKLPPSPFIKHENIFRIISQPGYNEKHPQHDAVFYVPTNKPGMRVPEQETLHDYSVGRVILLFSLAPCLLVPEPRLMAYVQRFSPIPKAPSRVSGLYAVAKLMQRGLPRYEVIAASQIARPCPLAPYIEGPAVAEGIGHASFDYYSKFYINKYRTPQNFTFLHHIDPPSASPPSTGPPSAAPPSVLP